MELIDECLKLIKQYSCLFISLKYLDKKGKLLSIDTYYQNIQSLKDHIDINSLYLIPAKFFLDPFRSHSTLNIFCDIGGNTSPRLFCYNRIKHEINTADEDRSRYLAELSFWNNFDEKSRCNSVDLEANLRADIILNLENCGIKTSTHRQGSSYNKSIIGICGNNAVDLADNIIISRYIIENTVASYGRYAKFNNHDNVNLKLIRIIQDTKFDEHYTNLGNNLKQIAGSCNRESVYGFEVKEVEANNYRVDQKYVIPFYLNTSENFIPYLATISLAELKEYGNKIKSDIVDFLHSTTY